jgi:hypothetical protein
MLNGTGVLILPQHFPCIDIETIHISMLRTNEHAVSIYDSLNASGYPIRQEAVLPGKPVWWMYLLSSKTRTSGIMLVLGPICIRHTKNSQSHQLNPGSYHSP